MIKTAAITALLISVTFGQAILFSYIWPVPVHHTR